MPKYPTFPTLYDDCLQLSISFLRKHGYLTANQRKTGTVTWSRGTGEEKQITGQITISVNTHPPSYIHTPYLELDYKYRGEPVNYKVQLASIPSNIGKGVVWYFRCPHTGKRCRKLYSVGKYFFHRTAFIGCMYETQTQSKQDKIWGKLFEREKILDELEKPYYKETYKGRYTKRAMKLLKKAERIVTPLEVAALKELFRK